MGGSRRVSEQTFQIATGEQMGGGASKGGKAASKDTGPFELAPASHEALKSAQENVKQLLGEVARLRDQLERGSTSTAGITGSMPAPQATAPASRPKASLLKQLSLADGQLNEELGAGGGFTKDTIREFLKRRDMEMEDEAIDELFSTCDINKDGTVTLEEFTQVIGPVSVCSLGAFSPCASVPNVFSLFRSHFLTTVNSLSAVGVITGFSLSLWLHCPISLFQSL